MGKNEPNYIWKDRKRTFFGLPLSFTVYYLTPKKLITRTGFLNLTEEEVDLYKITDKSLKLPFTQRLFGCGTIKIYSRDTDTPETEILSIKKPRIVMELLNKYIDEERDRYHIRGRDMYAFGHHSDHDDNTDE